MCSYFMATSSRSGCKFQFTKFTLESLFTMAKHVLVHMLSCAKCSLANRTNVKFLIQMMQIDVVSQFV